MLMPFGEALAVLSVSLTELPPPAGHINQDRVAREIPTCQGTQNRSRDLTQSTQSDSTADRSKSCPNLTWEQLADDMSDPRKAVEKVRICRQDADDCEREGWAVAVGRELLLLLSKIVPVETLRSFNTPFGFPRRRGAAKKRQRRRRRRQPGGSARLSPPSSRETLHMTPPPCPRQLAATGHRLSTSCHKN